MKKYRPVLTVEQISHLIALCKKELSEESIRCIATLSPFLAKIQNCGVTEAYTQKPVKTQLETLGFSTEISPQQQRAQLYQSYVNSGEDPNLFSAQQLIQIQLYLYENDLMSEEEERNFELLQFNE